VLRRSRIGQRLDGLPRSLTQLNRSLQHLGSLRRLGWHRSLDRQASVDALGRALPWYTYPCIEWLRPQLQADDVVFEFGAGWSTLWYAARVRRVVTVEHDEVWHARLAGAVPENVELHLRRARADGGDAVDGAVPSPYVRCIDRYPSDSFDIVAVDGVERPACSTAALPFLKPEGLLILDNSERPEYRSTVERLAERRYGRIDFHGFAPGSGVPGCTSVFSRSFDRWISASPALQTWGL